MKILFFTPYAFIDVHTYPEGVVADNFRRRGHDVLQVGCRGLYSDYCVSMSCLSLRPDSDTETKRKVCLQCQDMRDRLNKDFGFPCLYLDDYIEPEDAQRVEAFLESVTPSNWTSILFEEMPIALYACYEYFLNEKICSTTIEPRLWPGFIVHVKNAALTAIAGRRILDDVAPDALVAYNSLYSCNHVMTALGERQSVASYMVHASLHLRRQRSKITIFSGLIPFSEMARSPAWDRYVTRPLSKDSIALANEHVAELLDARSPWVYSIRAQNMSRDDLRSRFGISQAQKVLLVTMSSGDEIFAAYLIGAYVAPPPMLFKNQLEWISALLKWVEGRPDLFLLIRVHPREFPNKRESVLSQQAILLRERFEDLPSNARVNWPADALSLHDVAKITDLCLNSTSTAGLEALLLGIPVLISDRETLMSYPPSLNLTADSRDAYFAAIDKGLSAGRHLDNIIGAFRWISFMAEVASIDISEAYDEHRSVASPTMRSDDDARPRRGWIARLRRAFGPRPAPAAAPETGPMFWSGLERLKEAEWLAYAVEHGTESHMNAFVDRIERHPPASAEEERVHIAQCARHYLDRLDLWSGLAGVDGLGIEAPSSDEDKGFRPQPVV